MDQPTPKYDKEALKMAFTDAAKQGYNKDISTFHNLLKTDEGARKMAFEDAVKQGYGKTIDDFSSLLDLKKKGDTTSTSTTKIPSTDSAQKNGSSATQEFEYKPKLDAKTGKEVYEKDASGKLVPAQEKVLKGYATERETELIKNDELKKKASVVYKPSVNYQAYKKNTDISDEEKDVFRAEIEAEENNEGILNKVDGAFRWMGDVLENKMNPLLGRDINPNLGEAFSEEKKQAQENLLEEFKGDESKITPELLKEKTRELVLDKRTEAARIDKNNTFLSNLSEKDKNALNLEKVQHYKTLGDKDKYIITQAELLNRNLEDLSKNAVVINKLAEEYAQKGQKLPQKFIESALQSKEEFISKAEELSKLEKEYNQNTKETGSVEDEIDFIKRRYGLINKANTYAKLGFGDLYVNVNKKLPILISDLDEVVLEKLGFDGVKPIDDSERQALIDDIIDWESAKENEINKISKNVSFDNLKLSNFGEFFAQEAGSQGATFAQIALPGGVPMMGLTSTADKYGQMEVENETLGKGYSRSQMFAASVGFGLSEAALGALPTKGVFSRSIIAFEKSGQRTLLREGYGSYIKKKAATVGDDLLTETVTEGLTQLTQNWIDIKILGKKDVGYFDGVKHAAFSGGLFGGGMSIAPAILGATLRPFSDNKSGKKVRDNMESIFRLQSALNNPDISDVAKKTIEDKINLVESQNKEILTSIAKKTETMPTEIIDAIIGVNKKQELLTLQASEIKADPSLSKELKKELISGLEVEYNSLEKKRANLVSDKANILDALPDSEKNKLKERAGRELIKNAEAVGFKEASFNDTQITAKALEIYSKREINKEAKKAENEQLVVEKTTTDTKEQATEVEPATSVSLKEENKNESTPEGNIDTESEQKNIISLGTELMDAVREADFKLRADGKGSKEIGRINLETLSITEEDILYNENKEYKKLFDKSEDGTLTEQESERMSEIYVAERTKKQVKLLGELYQREKGKGNSSVFVDVVDKILQENAQKQTKQNEATPQTNTPINGDVQPRVEPMGEVAESGQTTTGTLEEKSVSNTDESKPTKGNVKRIKSLKDAYYDVTFDKNGFVEKIHSVKDGREIPKFIERTIVDKKTNKSRKIVSKNSNYSRIEADALNIDTDNKIKQDKIKSLSEFEPTNEYEAALQSLASGSKVSVESLGKETGNKDSYWATNEKSKTELPSIEALSETISEGTDLDQQEVRNALIEIISTNSSVDSLLDQVHEISGNNKRELQKQEMESYLGGLSEKDLAMYESLQAEDNFISELTDEETVQYYQEKINEYEDSKQQEGKTRIDEKPNTVTPSNEKPTTKERIAERIKTKNAKIDDVANTIKDMDSIFGFKIKADNIDGVDKQGIDFIAVIADIVKQAVAAGIHIDEAIKKTVEHFQKTYDLDSDTISQVKEKLNPKKEFKNNNDKNTFEYNASFVPDSDVLITYLGAETTEKYTKQKVEVDTTVNKMRLVDALHHGVNTIEFAKMEHGDDFVSKTLEFLEDANIPPHAKALTYVSLSNELDRQRKEFPEDRSRIQKQIDLVDAKRLKFARQNSLAINMSRLQSFAKLNYDITEKTDLMFSSQELSDRKKIEKTFEATADEINEEYEKQDKLYTQEDFDAELKEKIEEYESGLGSNIYSKMQRQIKREGTNRTKEQLKSERDDLSAKLKKIAKTHFNRANSNPIAFEAIPVIAQLVKNAIQSGAVNIDSALDEVVFILKDIYVDIKKSDIIKVLYDKKSVVMSDETKRKIYIKLLNKQINSLDEQIEAGEIKINKREDRYKGDKEIEGLRNLREEKRIELKGLDPKYYEKAKVEKSIDFVQKQITELERRIDESDFSKEEKTVKKENNTELLELRKKRDVLKEVFSKNKKNYEKSLITPEEIYDLKNKNKIEELGQRLLGLKNKESKNNFGKSSVWSKEISYLQEVIKNEREDSKGEVTKKASREVKDLLIEAGYSREANVTVNQKDADGNNVLDAKGNVVRVKEKRTYFDWKKLAGEEGSVANMKERVEKVLKLKGYSDAQIQEANNDFKNEYTDLRASIVENGIREMNNRNKVKPSVNIRGTARKLAELYNFGIFEENTIDYNLLLNSALGFSDFQQETYKELEKYGKALASLMAVDSKYGEGQKLSDLAIQTITSKINNDIKKITSSASFQSGTKAFKTINVVSDITNLSQLSKLMSLGQFIENPLSGLIERQFQHVGEMFDNVDTKDLKADRKKIAKYIIKDILRNGGLHYGDVSTTLVNKSKVEDWLNEQSDSQVYHTVVSAMTAKLYLNGADSFNKALITEKFFQQNLIKMLTSDSNPNGKITKAEAMAVVSESLTGQNKADALKTAEEVIDKVNKDSGFIVIKKNEETIARFAQDIVRESLLVGTNLTIDNITEAYNAGYISAGFTLGHEANNIVSKEVAAMNSRIDVKLEKAVKEKKWSTAVRYTAESILVKNIMNPFVGGGMNWATIFYSKAGVNPISMISLSADWVGKKDNPLDMTTEQGVKNIQNALVRDTNFRKTSAKILIGSAVNIAMAAAMISSGADDDLDDWLKKNEWARPIFNKLSAPMVVAILAYKNDELGKYLMGTLNMRTDQVNDTMKILKSLQDSNTSTLGAVGKLAGSPFDTPVPWRLFRDVKNVSRGINGLPIIKSDYNKIGFWNGYFQGGFIDEIEFRPGVNYELKEKIQIVKDKASEHSDKIKKIADKYSDEKLTFDEMKVAIEGIMKEDIEKAEKTIDILKYRIPKNEMDKLKDPFYLSFKRESNDEVRALLFFDKFGDVQNLSEEMFNEMRKNMEIIRYNPSDDFNKYYNEIKQESKKPNKE